MCLIAYVPAGTSIPRDIFDYSSEQNPDGFGIMSAVEGVKKFFGRKARKRARRYTRLLSARQIPHAVHWRWKTHGDISEANCHPFTTPNGNAHIMHNGVLRDTAAYATAEKSDTRLFVDLLDDAPLSADDETESPYWGGVERAIGYSNKFVVLSGSKFYLLNEDSGVWIDGVWYSNTYSLPKQYDDSDPWNAGISDAMGKAFGADDDTELTQAELEELDRLDAEEIAAAKLAESEDYLAQYRPGARYDVNLGRWRMPEERKRAEFTSDQHYGESWQRFLNRKPIYPSGPTLDTDAAYADLMLPMDGQYND